MDEDAVHPCQQAERQGANPQSLQIQDLLLCPNVLLAKDQKESSTRSLATRSYRGYKDECLLKKDKTEMFEGIKQHLHQGMKQ